MTSQLPSVKAYVDVPTYRVLSELARVTGQSRSAIVRSVLEDSVPLFRAVVDSYDHLKALEALPGEKIDSLLRDLEAAAQIAAEAQRHVEQVLRDGSGTPIPLTGGSGGDKV